MQVTEQYYYLDVTPPRVFFTYFASANQLTGFSISEAYDANWLKKLV